MRNGDYTSSCSNFTLNCINIPGLYMRMYFDSNIRNGDYTSACSNFTPSCINTSGLHVRMHLHKNNAYTFTGYIWGYINLEVATCATATTPAHAPTSHSIVLTFLGYIWGCISIQTHATATTPAHVPISHQVVLTLPENTWFWGRA